MQVDFQKLQDDLSEVEMALLMAVDVAMNAAFIAGADPKMLVQHLEQHSNNFGALNQGVAQQIMAALVVLRKNASGLN